MTAALRPDRSGHWSASLSGTRASPSRRAPPDRGADGRGAPRCSRATAPSRTAAGAVAHLVQEGRLRARRPSSRRHGDARAVGQAEAGDIDRIGGGMLAPVADVAAVRCGGNYSCQNARSRRRAAPKWRCAAGWTTSHSHIASAAATGQEMPRPAGAKAIAPRSAGGEAHAVGIAAAAPSRSRRQHRIAHARPRRAARGIAGNPRSARRACAR